MTLSIFFANLIPRRIVSQIVGLVAVCVLLHPLLLTVVAAFVVPDLSDPTLKSEPFVTKSVAIARMLATAPDAGRRSKLLESAVSVLPSLRVETVVQPVQSIDADDFEMLLVDAVRRDIGVAAQAHGFIDATSRKRLLLTLPDGFSWSAVVPENPEGGYPSAIIIAALFGSFALVLLAISLWAARRLTLPLRRLAGDAAKFNADQPYTPVPEAGPHEVVQVARAFNEMGSRTSQLVEDRMHLLASISHDLRTPITRMRLRAEDITDPDVQKSTLADLGAMDRMVHSAMAFVRGMTQAQNYRIVDITSLLQTICDEFSDMGHPVTFITHARFPVKCDQDQISRAVTNIIENSLKYETPVEVSLSELDSSMVDIVVADLGPGIPEDQKRKVLKPFQRGETERGFESDRGFGLGLSICSAIAAAHGGKIVLEDNRPHGLIVRLRLPLAD
jgi:signal transduction histidine kinase